MPVNLCYAMRWLKYYILYMNSIGCLYEICILYLINNCLKAVSIAHLIVCNVEFVAVYEILASKPNLKHLSWYGLLDICWRNWFPYYVDFIHSNNGSVLCLGHIAHIPTFQNCYTFIVENNKYISMASILAVSDTIVRRRSTIRYTDIDIYHVRFIVIL